MSLLPRTIPTAALDRLTAALAAVGITLGALKPGTRVTRTAEHGGASWELTYMGVIGWRLTGPRAEHGIGVSAEEAAAHMTAEAPAPQRTVNVRIGTHRTAYHPDGACPALNGRPETYRGHEVMPEAEARERGLTLCAQCGTLLASAPRDYAGVPVPAIVRAAWTSLLGEAWRLGVRSALASS